MPIFSYRAINQKGNRITDTIESVSEDIAIQDLSQRGFQVFSIKSLTKKSSSRSENIFSKNQKNPKINSEEILLCIQELSTLLNAGIPLADAVLNIAQGHETRASGSILSNTYTNLRSGNSLAVSLRNSGLELPEYVHELIKAGEETGKLGAALYSASEQMTADAEFRRETKNALTYPIVLISSGLLATLVVFIFVVPKFANILTNPKAEIPIFSRWILHSGLWLVNNKLFFAACMTGFFISCWILFSQKKIRLQVWEAASKMPILGKWITNIELARWAGMFSVLLQNHVPLLDALNHSLNSLTSQSWRSRAELITRDVKSGRSLALAMQEHQFVDAIGLNLIKVGEQSGKLSQTTTSLANMHRTHAQQSMKQFLILLEPITILLISVLLGGIMISVMLAITSLTNVI